MRVQNVEEEGRLAKDHDRVVRVRRTAPGQAEDGASARKRIPELENRRRPGSRILASTCKPAEERLVGASEAEVSISIEEPLTKKIASPPGKAKKRDHAGATDETGRARTVLP